MGYLNYSTGFLGGGFNSAAVAGAGVVPGVTAATLGPWEPETATSFEAGIRSEWFDHRLQANITGFWSNYDNLQSFSSFLVNPATGLSAVGPANTGHELARGIEISTAATPIHGLHLSANVGYLDASFTSFKTVFNGQPYDCVAHGCKPVLSPNWTSHVDAAYDIETDVGRFTPSLGFSYTSAYYTDTFNDPYGRVPANGLLDAALTYQDPTGRWTASLWGKNITDKRYFLTASEDRSGAFPEPIFKARYYANPATVGVDLRIKLEQPRQ
jgi:iron complex outermembrane receptor protein